MNKSCAKKLGGRGGEGGGGHVHSWCKISLSSLNPSLVPRFPGFARRGKWKGKCRGVSEPHVMMH